MTTIHQAVYISMLSACATLEVLDKYRYDTTSARYEQKQVKVSVAV